MPVSPSFDDLVAQGLAEAQSRRPDLTFRDGDVTEAMLHGGAAMADAVIGYAVTLFRDTFFHGAKGDALTELVSDHTGGAVQRQAATAATVSVLFERTTGGAAGTIPAGTQIATEFDAEGKQIVFTTNTAITVLIGENGPFSVVATAEETGSGGNVAAGTVTQIIGTLFDTFDVGNSAASAGGNAEESDDELLKRAFNFYTTLRRGTLAALEFGALTVADVRVARAIEDPTTFAVTLVVSDSDGGSSLEMVANVQAVIEEWRCAGVEVHVLGGQSVSVDVTVSLPSAALPAGFDLSAIEQLIVDAVTARINKLKAGQTLYTDALIATVIAVDPDSIEDVEIAYVAGTGADPDSANDLVPAHDYTVIRAGTITVREI